MPENRRFILRRRPEGDPVPEDFELVEEDIPAPPPGGFVMRNVYCSLDPAQPMWLGTIFTTQRVGSSTGRRENSPKRRHAEAIAPSTITRIPDRDLTDARTALPLSPDV